MADSSDYGWMVVSEYETDELADNEEDEKRIGKAMKKWRRRRQRKRGEKDQLGSPEGDTAKITAARIVSRQ